MIHSYLTTKKSNFNEIVPGTSKMNTNTRPVFYYSGVLIDETTPWNHLYQVANKLGIKNPKSKTSNYLCQSIYNVLVSTEQFYDPLLVQNLNGQKFSLSSESESEMKAPDDDNDDISTQFIFPASRIGWQNSTSRNEGLSNKQKKVWAEYIQQMKKAIFYSPDLQIAGALDTIQNIQPPNLNNIENSIWADCDDDIFEEQKIETRHVALKMEKKHVPRISAYTNMSQNAKMLKLVQICVRSSTNDFMELQNLLASFASERVNLNKPISAEIAASLSNSRCTGIEGQTPLQAAITCPNLLLPHVDSYLIVRELICAHVKYGLPEIDLNAPDKNGDTPLIIAMRRCDTIRKEIAAMREANNDPELNPSDKIPDANFNSMVSNAYVTLHDIVVLLLKPGGHCKGDTEFEHLPVNVNKDNNGVTPLHVAVRSGCLRCFTFLQKHSKNLDATIQDKENGRTALMDAVRLDNPMMVYRLLEENINLRARDMFYSTVFHAAARHGMKTGYIRYQNQADQILKLWNKSHGVTRTTNVSILEMLYEALQKSIEGSQQFGKTTKEIERIKTKSTATKEEEGGDQKFRILTKEATELNVREQKKRMQIQQMVIDALDINGLTALMISTLKRDKDAVDFFLYVANADPEIQQKTIQATALQMLEYDVVPEIDENKAKERKEIVETLRLAEESAARKKKAARLATPGALHVEGTETKSTLGALSATLPSILRSYESDIALVYKELKDVFADKTRPLSEITVKYLERFLSPEVYLLNSLTETDRKAFLSERYRIAQFYNLNKLNERLSDLEETIRRATTTELSDQQDPIYHLYNYLERRVIPQARQ